MIETYAKCNNCCREYRCIIARDLYKCIYCGHEDGSVKVVDRQKDKKKEPLLTIELQDESSVPKVFYKGEELTGKAYVNFEWKTREEYKGTGGVNFKVEHIGKGTKSIHVIGRRNGEYL